MSKGLVKNQLRNFVLFLPETESSNFWTVKYTKMRKKMTSTFFHKVTFTVYFAVQTTTLTRFANGFMNGSPTILELYVINLIVILLHCDCARRFDIVVFLKSN